MKDLNELYEALYGYRNVVIKSETIELKNDVVIRKAQITGFQLCGDYVIIETVRGNKIKITSKGEYLLEYAKTIKG